MPEPQSVSVRALGIEPGGWYGRRRGEEICARGARFRVRCAAHDARGFLGAERYRPGGHDHHSAAAAKKKKKPLLHPSVARKVATGSFTLVAGGDIAMSGAGADDSTFAGISRFLHGDIVFGNLEGTLATGGTPKCSPYGVDGCFTFRADPSSVGALKRAGFTVMNLANNHALDYGPDAQAQTIAALSRCISPTTAFRARSRSSTRAGSGSR